MVLLHQNVYVPKGELALADTDHDTLTATHLYLLHFCSNNDEILMIRSRKGD